MVDTLSSVRGCDVADVGLVLLICGGGLLGVFLSLLVRGDDVASTVFLLNAWLAGLIGVVFFLSKVPRRLLPGR